MCVCMYCKVGNSFQFSFLALLSSFELGIGHMGLTIFQSYILVLGFGGCRSSNSIIMESLVSYEILC